MQIKPEKKVCLLVVIQTQGLLPSESMFFVSLYSGQGLFTRETKHNKTKKPRNSAYYKKKSLNHKRKNKGKKKRYMKIGNNDIM